MKNQYVYGPQGSGKTFHSEALRKHFGLKRVIEFDEVKAGEELPKTGCLILANQHYHYQPKKLKNPNFQIHDIQTLKEQLGLKDPQSTNS